MEALVVLFPTELVSSYLEFPFICYCSSGTRQKSCLAVVPLVCSGSTAPPGVVLLRYAGTLPPEVVPRKVPRTSGSGPLELPLEVPSARFSPLDSQRYLAGTSHVLPPEPLIHFEVCQRYYRKESAVVPLLAATVVQRAAAAAGSWYCLVPLGGQQR